MKKSVRPFLWLVIGALAPLLLAPLPARAGAAKEKKPKIEVVFVLDTTGSMAGLIDGAKRKIWSMVNQILSGKPTPEVKVGLIAYRDRGDEYVTKATPLTTDIDAIYARLTEFRAAGGGDTPESVNQALHEAVTKIEWSADKDTLKIIYLVGDAPPHMDYAQDVKYPETCAQAVRGSILINTVQCGGIPGTKEVWTKIAQSAEGQYAAIPQDGGAVAIVTPFDAELNNASAELGRKTYLYGAGGFRAESERKLALNVAQAPEGAASRAGAQAKAGRVAEYDFLDAVREKRVDPNKLTEEELPVELRKLTPKEREAKLRQLQLERDVQLKRITELTRKRDAFIADEQKKSNSGKDGFDAQVLTQLRSQAARYRIRY